MQSNKQFFFNCLENCHAFSILTDYKQKPVFIVFLSRKKKVSLQNNIIIMFYHQRERESHVDTYTTLHKIFLSISLKSSASTKHTLLLFLTLLRSPYKLWNICIFNWSVVVLRENNVIIFGKVSCCVWVSYTRIKNMFILKRKWLGFIH